MTREKIKELIESGKLEEVKKLSGKELATIVKDNFLSDEKEQTLIQKGKDRMIKLIVGKESKKANMEDDSLEAKELSKDILNTLDEFKIAFKDKPLNPFLKKQGRGVLQTYLQKFKDSDEDSLKNIGFIGHIAIAIALIVDCVVDIDKLKEKIKAKVKAKQEQQQTEVKK